jgi:hypothetical protein
MHIVFVSQIEKIHSVKESIQKYREISYCHSFAFALFFIFISIQTGMTNPSDLRHSRCHPFPPPLHFVVPMRMKLIVQIAVEKWLPMRRNSFGPTPIPDHPNGGLFGELAIIGRVHH